MKKVIVSSSMLATASLCMTKAVGQTEQWTIGGRGKDEAPMEAGIAGHVALEQWVQGQPPHVVQRAFHDAYKPFSDAFVLSDDRLHLSNLTRVMEAFTAQCTLAEQPFELVVAKGEIQTEQQIFAPLSMTELSPKEARYNAYISDKSDGIVREKETGSLYSLEFKTTGEFLGDDTLLKYMMDGQLSTHTHVLRENGYDVAGVLLFLIQFSKLPQPVFNKDGKPKKCATHHIPQTDCWSSHLRYQKHFIQRSPEQLMQWKREAEREAYEYAEAVEAFRASGNDFSKTTINMKGLFNGTCKNCHLRQFCLSDRRNFGMLTTRPSNDPTIVRSGVYDA